MIVARCSCHIEFIEKCQFIEICRCRALDSGKSIDINISYDTRATQEKFAANLLLKILTHTYNIWSGALYYGYTCHSFDTQICVNKLKHSKSTTIVIQTIQTILFDEITLFVLLWNIVLIDTSVARMSKQNDVCAMHLKYSITNDFFLPLLYGMQQIHGFSVEKQKKNIFLSNMCSIDCH